MTYALAVIGAGYGDEGKGLMTDYLVRKHGAKVTARFNGGAQAGHTVNSDSKRHVFSHVGAGTFAGADTYLSGYFLTNPYLLVKELQAISRLGFIPSIYVSEFSRVTTIYDMAINAAIELSRGADRHGSCGIGINETVTRDMAGWMLNVGDVKDRSAQWLANALRHIHEVWVPERLAQLGLSDMPEQCHLDTGNVLRNDAYGEHAARIITGLQLVNVVDNIERTAEAAPVVLEGAQGLALDEELGEFPHVTRSLTGLPQAASAAADFGMTKVQPIYMTRAYATRHGAGPFEHEGETISPTDIIDTTNVTNPWQGQLRFAPLDLGRLRHFIHADLQRGTRDGTVEVVNPVIAMTCLDQVGPDVAIYDVSGNRRVVHVNDLPAIVTHEVGVTVSYISRGPTAKDVVQISGFDV